MRARAGFIEDLEWLLDSGVTDQETLARRLNVPTVDALKRRIFRARRFDLYARMGAPA